MRGGGHRSCGPSSIGAAAALADDDAAALACAIALAITLAGGDAVGGRGTLAAAAVALAVSSGTPSLRLVNLRLVPCPSARPGTERR